MENFLEKHSRICGMGGALTLIIGFVFYYFFAGLQAVISDIIIPIIAIVIITAAAFITAHSHDIPFLKWVVAKIAAKKLQRKNLAEQQMMNQQKQQHEFNYWNIAIIMKSIVERHHSLLKIEVPRDENALKPPDYDPYSSSNYYTYILLRLPSNTPNSDNAITHIDVCKIVKFALKQMGAVNYDVKCNAFNSYYIVSICAEKDFNLSNAMPKNVGIFRVISYRYCNPNTNMTEIIDRYEIAYLDGRVGIVKIGKPFSLYQHGIWYSVVIMQDDFDGHVYLSPFGDDSPVEYVGWVARA